MKTVLSIQSQVVGARVGNSIAAFAFERLGVKAICLPTTLLGRRPDRAAIAGAHPGGGAIPASELMALLDALEADGALKSVDVVLSGYLGEAEQAQVVVEAAQRVKRANPQAIYVCDPVMGDFDSGRYVSPETAEAIARVMVPVSDLILPNAWELGQLAGMAVSSVGETLRAARVMGRPGPRHVRPRARRKDRRDVRHAAQCVAGGNAARARRGERRGRSVRRFVHCAPPERPFQRRRA